jgi:hypothetical protein
VQADVIWHSHVVDDGRTSLNCITAWLDQVYGKKQDHFVDVVWGKSDSKFLTWNYKLLHCYQACVSFVEIKDLSVNFLPFITYPTDNLVASSLLFFCNSNGWKTSRFLEEIIWWEGSLAVVSTSSWGGNSVSSWMELLLTIFMRLNQHHLWLLFISFLITEEILWNFSLLIPIINGGKILHFSLALMVEILNITITQLVTEKESSLLVLVVLVFINLAHEVKNLFISNVNGTIKTLMLSQSSWFSSLWNLIVALFSSMKVFWGSVVFIWFL